MMFNFLLSLAANWFSSAFKPDNSDIFNNHLKKAEQENEELRINLRTCRDRAFYSLLVIVSLALVIVYLIHSCVHG